MGRRLALWAPDWSLTAAGITAQEPAVTLRDGVVVAVTASARSQGVRRGQRWRTAMARCPSLLALHDDPRRDESVFGPLAAVVATKVAALEILRPGLVIADVHVARRHFVAEQAFAQSVAMAVQAVIEQAPSCRIGIAEGRFAALLACAAAGSDPRANGVDTGAAIRIVDPGDTTDFLAAQPVSRLRWVLAAEGIDAASADRLQEPLEQMLRLFGSLGIEKMGHLAALSEQQMVDRFGRIGQWAYRQVTEVEEQPVGTFLPPEDDAVSRRLDPPAERVDQVAFVGRQLAEQLMEQLRRQAAHCRLVSVEIVSARQERIERQWRSSDGFTVSALTDRVRWQLDGWLRGNTPEASPSTGIEWLVFRPTEIIQGGEQVSLLAEPTDQDRVVAQVLARLQGLLGQDAVLMPHLAGGRDPSAWITARPWLVGPPAPNGAVRSRSRAERKASAHPTLVPVWPGRLPSPAPATVLSVPLAVEVLDAHGRAVTVSGRGALSAAPVFLRQQTDTGQSILAWSGPWPIDEQWWRQDGRRRARLQVVTQDGRGWLISCQAGQWQIEAHYD